MNKNIIFIITMVVFASSYFGYVHQIQSPIWDPSIFLLNARDWSTGSELHEAFRSPLLSLLFSLVWVFTGESFLAVKFLSATFMIVSGILLYYLLKEQNWYIAYFTVILTLINPFVLYYTSHLYTESLALMLTLFGLYCIKKGGGRYAIAAGIFLGLVFAARYYVVIQAAVLFGSAYLYRWFTTKHKHKKDFYEMIYREGMWFGTAAAITLFLTVYIVTLKAGEFNATISKDSAWSLMATWWYVNNAFAIWGPAIFLLPFMFLKKNFIKSESMVYFMWFLAAFIFWSGSPTNQQTRFVIQFTPAVYYLALIGTWSILERGSDLIRMLPIRVAHKKKQ